MKTIYMINGWEESKSYFRSFGFSEDSIKEMKKGKAIERGGNVFRIVFEDEDGHRIDPEDVEI